MKRAGMSVVRSPARVNEPGADPAGPAGATLWIVATPLGRVDDLSPRAREVLGSCALVLAEDTRRTRRLAQEAGIGLNRVESNHEHNEETRAALALDVLAGGGDVAVVSDAGTPLLCDPGYPLVRRARQAGFRVSPVPGPCSVTAALSASGLPPYPFLFLGFLPRKAGEVRKLFAQAAHMPATLVFFDRKDRVRESLAIALEVLGERECCLARELTKTFEEFITGTLSELSAAPDELLGELTVVIGPGTARRSTEDEVLAALREAASLGGKPKEVAARAAAGVAGWTAKEVYALSQGRT